MADSFFAAVGKILIAQILVIVLVATAIMLLVGWQWAASSLLGGFAAFVPNVYFAWRIGRSNGQEPKKIIQSYYKGESGKLILTAVLFAIILQVPNIQSASLFVGYFAALSVFWFALLMR